MSPISIECTCIRGCKGLQDFCSKCNLNLPQYVLLSMGKACLTKSSDPTAPNLYLKTMYDSRTMDGPTFLEEAKKASLKIKSIHDAKRLRRIAVIAQEEGELGLSDELYAEVKRWRPITSQLPELWREAELYQADRIYSLGNYFEADKRYREILANEAFSHSDRDWAYLQVARLYELKGKLKPSLRIYGQIAYSAGENSLPWQTYAASRLAAIATNKQMDQIKELLSGEF